MTGLEVSSSRLLGDPAVVAIAGDWHGNTDWALRMLPRCRNQGVDVVLHLGDFGFWPGFMGDRYLDQVNSELEVLDQTLFFIDGNHEWFDHLLALPLDHNGVRPVRERIFHLPRGFRWRWHGQTWMGLGGAVSIDQRNRTPGVSWWPQEEISAAEADTASAEPVDVLLTHDVPFGVPKMERLIGSHRGDPLLARAEAHRRLLRGVVDRTAPSHLWHGHMHRRYEDILQLTGWSVQVHGLACDEVRPERNVVTVQLPLAQP